MPQFELTAKFQQVHQISWRSEAASPTSAEPAGSRDASVRRVRQGHATCVRHPQGWCPLATTGYCAAYCPRYQAGRDNTKE